MYEANITEDIINIGVDDKNIKVFDSSIEKEKVQKLVEKSIRSNHNKSAYYLKQKMQLKKASLV